VRSHEKQVKEKEMPKQRFKVGDAVEFFARYNSDPRHTGKVIWARGDDLKSFGTIRDELVPLVGMHFCFSAGGLGRGYIVEVLGPKGSRKLFAPREASMTLAPWWACTSASPPVGSAAPREANMTLAQDTP
jgi:hypothetical protein